MLRLAMAAAVAVTVTLPATADAQVGFGGGVRPFDPVGVAGPGFDRAGTVRRGPAVPPFNYGLDMYGMNYGLSCWRDRPTPFGWRKVWVCGFPDYGLPYWWYHPNWY